jgi:hypothetical protein
VPWRWLWSQALRFHLAHLAKSIEERPGLTTVAGEYLGREAVRCDEHYSLTTREITKLQAIGQYILYKNSEPPPPQTSAPVATRSSQVRTAR